MKNTIIKVLSVVMAMVFAFGSCLVAVSAAEPACDHANAVVYGKVEASCETWGYTLYECPDCENFFFTEDEVNELIPPHCFSDGFAWKDVATVDATCVAKGYTTKTCSVCDNVIIEEFGEIDPDGHKYGDWETTTESTCTGEGLEERTCELCGDVDKKDVDALGHNWVADEDKVEAPTCKAEGSMPYHCTECDATREVVIAKCGHLYEFRTEKKGACGVQGWAAGNYCKWCGIHDGNGTGYYPLEQHEIDENAADTTVIPATCLDAGSMTGTCTNCGAKNVTAVIPALGHEWERPGAHDAAITVTAGCLTWGYELFGCADCAETIVKNKVAPLGHHLIADPNATPVPPTCDKAGGIKLICDRTWITWDYKTNTYKNMSCDYTDVEEDPAHPALGHDTVDVIAVAPTCTTPGNTAGVRCTRCTYTTVTVIPALGHTPVKYICTELSLMDVKCSVCGAYIPDGNGVPQIGVTIVLDEGAAESHIWTSTVVTPAGCESIGWMKYTCKYCGYSYEQAIPALGHDHVIEYKAPNCTETGYKTDKCRRCGTQFVEEFYPIVPDAHVGVKDTQNSYDPTCTTGGKEIGVCELCSLPYEKLLDATGHNYVTVEGYPAECGKVGYEDGVQCTECGDWKIPMKEIPALEHDWEEFDEVPADCENAGVGAGKTCKICDLSVGFAVLPALNPGHLNLSEDHPDENDATCANGGMYGYDYHGCPYCDYAEIDNFEYAPEHDWSVPTNFGVTCTEDGYTYSVCNACGEEKIVITDKAPGHLDKDGNVISSACNRGEIEDTYCVTCKTDIEAACDWKFERQLPATCIVYAHDIYVCKYCEKEKIVAVYEEDLSIYHDFTVTRDPETGAPEFDKAVTITKVCDRCGYEEVDYEFKGVEFTTKVVNGTGADKFVNGSKELKVEIYMKGDKAAFNTVYMQYTFNSTALEYKNAVANTEIIHGGEFEKNVNGDVITMSFCESNEGGELGSLELTGEDVLFATLTFKIKDNYLGLGQVGAASTQIGNIKDTLLVIDANNDVVYSEIGNTTPVQDVYLRGDITGDGMINSHDLVAMRKLIAINSQTAIGDISLDGNVNQADFIILRNWVIGALSYPALNK